MADILKITTPLVDRVPTQAARPVADPSVPFDLSDVTRVIQTQDPNEILQQNTGYVPDDSEAPKILADLLRDPAVTATMIRNITMLQEVISLVPATNAALTQEIEQLFDALLLNPEDIVGELMRQEQSTTLFKGELFDALRTLLAQSQNKPETATSIGVLLKGMNAALGRRDTLESIANNLTFLANSLDASPTLFEKLENLAAAFRAPNAPENFQTLKEEVFAALKDVQNSILYTPKMEKVLPLVVYNLSRYNDSEDFLPDALRLLLSNMDGNADKDDLVQKLQAYLDRYSGPDGNRAARGAEQDSRVIDVLAKIINKQAKSEDIELLSGDKIEKIVHSLLSSPSNFTPLLHFIIPVETMDLRAFAEIWIDPNAEEEATRKGGGTADNIHMLMVFDVEGIGRFESELYVQGKRIALNLLCPPAYMQEFRGIGPAIRQAVAATGYSFEAINIDKLDRTHSLMEVFRDLPHKRMGIDVKV